MLRIHPIGGNKEPDQQVFYAEHADLDKGSYLCRKGNHIFVSDLRLIKKPDCTLPANSKMGCFFVSPPTGPAIPIDLLDEICLVIH